MNLFTHTVVLGFLNVVVAKFCIIDLSPAIKWERQLLKDLQKNYDVTKAPKPSGCEPSVKIRFTLRYFNLDCDEGILTMQVWMHLDWYDERLKWDPEKYGGISKTQMFSGHIWMPYVKLFNGLDPDFDRFDFEYCGIESTGNVTCVKRNFYETICNVKLDDFPYDAQACDVELGAYGNNKSNYKMNFSSRAITMLGADYGSQWYISDYKQRSEESKQLIMTFVFEREAESLAAVIVYPSVIISFVTLISLFLDVRNNVRLALVCFSMFSHYYWLIEIGENIPKVNKDPPRLLIYYRGSMLMTVLAILITFALNFICKKKTAPPNMIITLNNSIQKSYARFLVFPQWNVEIKMENNENDFNTNWIMFANIANSVCIFVSIVACISMYFMLIPQPIPINFD